MSSNSTKVPGMNGGTDYQDLYSRGQGAANSGARRAGTVVPGMNNYAPDIEKKRAESNAPAPAKVPVVGFLYSISRQGFGEYWPLHIGSNKIGRSADCDICLAEATVSERHASLNIKQLKSANKIIASIRDDGSKTGIYVNDEELDFDTHEVKNNDLITIGHNYVLLVVLIDAAEKGLTVAENFQATDEVAEENIDDSFPGMTHDSNNTNTDSFYNPANRVDNGTVAMDGTPQPLSGRTKFL